VDCVDLGPPYRGYRGLGLAYCRLVLAVANVRGACPLSIGVVYPDTQTGVVVANGSLWY
jgi:hypothetical protein